jgi:DNA-binding NarL/FixJ family response regulator
MPDERKVQDSTMGDGLTVLLADADREARASVRASLESAGMHVVAEAGDTEEAVELALEFRPAVCVIDLHADDRSGLGAAAVLARVLDETSVVLLADDLTIADVLDAVRVGAAGCLSKLAGAEALAAAIAAAAAGEAAFPRRELRQALGFLVPQVA